METLSALRLVNTRLPSAVSPKTLTAGEAPLVLRFRFKPLRRFWTTEREKPGRKIVLWVSPGWPPLVGLENERDAKLRQLQEEVFGNVVEVSTQLRQGQITVFSLDPSALGDLEMGLTDPPTIHLRPSRQGGLRGGSVQAE